MRVPNNNDAITTNLVAIILATLLFALYVAYKVYEDRIERAMIESGECTLLEEGLYQPPPRVTGSDGNVRSYDREPYWRKVYRCTNNQIVTRRD